MLSTTLKKVLVVASVALTLPVLGAGAAYADGGNAHGSESNNGKSDIEHGTQHESATGSSEHGSSKGTETDPSGSSANPDGTFQGKSTSTPDQDGKGADHGAHIGIEGNNDKTGAGTDGNNGCGNEPRLAAPRDGGRPTDDDNNGWCGSKPRPTHATRVPARVVRIDTTYEDRAEHVTATPSRAVPAVTDVTAAPAVAASSSVRTSGGRVSAEAVAPAAVVEGPVQGPRAGTTAAAAAVSGAAAGAALPFTGAPVGLLLIVAGLCLGMGAAFSLAGTRRTA